MKKIRVGVKCNEFANKRSGLQGRVKIMAIPDKRDKAHQPVPWKLEERMLSEGLPELRNLDGERQT